MARAEYHVAIIHGRQETYNKASKFFENSITRFEGLGNRTQEMRVRTNYAALLMNSGQNLKGIQQAQKALEFFKKAGANSWIARNANNIADAYLEMGDLDNSEAYAKKVMEQEDTHTYGYGVFTFGDIKRQQGKYQEAIDILKMSLEQAERTEDKYLIAYCYQALGEAQIGLKEFNKALEILQEAERLFSEMNIPSELEKTQNLIRSLS